MGFFALQQLRFEFVFGLVDSESVPESDGEVGHNTASSGIRRPDGWTSLAVFRSLQQLHLRSLGRILAKWKPSTRSNR